MVALASDVRTADATVTVTGFRLLEPALLSTGH
jgi:hypothetical protein